MSTHTEPAEAVGSPDRLQAAIAALSVKNGLDADKLETLALRAQSYQQKWGGTFHDATLNVMKSAAQGKSESDRRKLLPYGSALRALAKKLGGADGEEAAA